MYYFTRKFGNIDVRMVSIENIVYYSAYDVATALNIENKRRAVNMAVIMEDGTYVGNMKWGNEQILFLSLDYVIAITLNNTSDSLCKSFILWLNEAVTVSASFYKYEEPQQQQSNLSEDRRDYFAITQIAKKYDLTAKELNELLHKNGIQYKVNDQWVLYSQFSDLGLTKTIPVKRGENVYLHTYWTEKGLTFIEKLLNNLGYEQHYKQLSLF